MPSQNDQELRPDSNGHEEQVKSVYEVYNSLKSIAQACQDIISPMVLATKSGSEVKAILSEYREQLLSNRSNFLMMRRCFSRCGNLPRSCSNFSKTAKPSLVASSNFSKVTSHKLLSVLPNMTKLYPKKRLAIPMTPIPIHPAILIHPAVSINLAVPIHPAVPRASKLIGQAYTISDEGRESALSA